MSSIEPLDRTKRWESTLSLALALNQFGGERDIRDVAKYERGMDYQQVNGGQDPETKVRTLRRLWLGFGSGSDVPTRKLSLTHRARLLRQKDKKHTVGRDSERHGRAF